MTSTSVLDLYCASVMKLLKIRLRDTRQCEAVWTQVRLRLRPEGGDSLAVTTLDKKAGRLRRRLRLEVGEVGSAITILDKKACKDLVGIGSGLCRGGYVHVH